MSVAEQLVILVILSKSIAYDRGGHTTARRTATLR